MQNKWINDMSLDARTDVQAVTDIQVNRYTEKKTSSQTGGRWRSRRQMDTTHADRRTQ